MIKSWSKFLKAAAASAVLASFAVPVSAAPFAVVQETTDESKEEAPKEDPFAVPDGTPAELAAFIQKLATMRPTARTPEERTAEQTKRLNAVIAACTKIIEQKPEEKVELFAIENRFMALSSLVTSLDPSRAGELDALTAELKKDTRPAVIKLVAGVELGKAVVEAMRSRNSATMKDVAQQVLGYCETFGVDPAVMRHVSTVGRALGAAGETDAGVEFYERMSEFMSKSEDQRFRDRAETMLGAARMLKLPGNFMEVRGKLADGSEFKWEDYRGKVVLVDFWASWCGPCLGELPNMKKNLAKYNDKGFEIVGINMDDDNARFEKCLADKEITWTNIVGEGDGNKGWAHPLARYYGISAIPAAILVDKEGKVISLRARGAELDKLLEEQFGPVEEPVKTTP
ncbi:MAG: TlpA family protein disulfide reductase [Planctomyces sp.]|nr:TlpA family protein disulfide reductase [Planctomyces sp.]